jgi:hypothetical protein
MADLRVDDAALGPVGDQLVAEREIDRAFNLAGGAPRDSCRVYYT